MISGPATPGGRPGGEQPTVDRADLEGAEEVAQVCRDGGEAAAVEGDDDDREQHEERGGGCPVSASST